MKSIVLLMGCISVVGCAAVDGTMNDAGAEINEEVNTNMSVGDTSRNSLDWIGLYEGVLPCASCMGINKKIKLSEERYIINIEYIGVETDGTAEVSGEIKWNAEGNKVTLADNKQYLVGENRLFMLDINGRIVDGALSNSYVLIKVE